MFWFIYVSKFYKFNNKVDVFWFIGTIDIVPQIGVEQTVVLSGVEWMFDGMFWNDVHSWNHVTV